MPPPPSPLPPMIITSKFEMHHWSRTIHLVSKSICLVPTMGSLHAGHLSLIAEARTRADAVVVSIYLNPGQFSRGEDIGTYPSDFEGDLGKIKGLGGVDVVFHPYNLYDYGDDAGGSGGGGGGGDTAQRGDEVVSCVEDRGGGHETWVRVEKLEKGLCGKSRPLFFRGVATVVTKLFNIVEPDVAIFGKKDYQQWRIIQRMVRDLDLPVQIIAAEIVREDDGLALSSRNVYLSPEEREKALSINRSLSKAKSDALKGQIDCKELRKFVAESIQAAGGRVDYSEIVDQESLEPVEEITGPVVFCVAAWFGNARLLDNVEINIPK